MNGKKKDLIKIILVIFNVLLFIFVFQAALSQSIESAKEKIKNGDLDGAEAEVVQILKKDENNIDALELLTEIKKLKKVKESEVLTKKAILAIEDENFDVAYRLLEKALLLNPDNEKARELYLSLTEVVSVEKKSEEEEKKKEIAEKEKQQEPVKDNNVVVTQKEGEPNKQIVLAEKKKIEFHNWFEAELSPLFAFTNSNRLSYIDSGQSLVGSHVGINYYPKSLKGSFGFSLNYISFFIKVSGLEYIKFNVHRVNAFIVYRKSMFEDRKENRMIIQPKLGYSYFYLKNLMEYGAYNFTRLYGPVAGFNIIDPVFYRFIDNDFFKRLGLKFGFNILYIPQKNAPLSPEMCLGLFYKLSKYNINLKFRTYMIFQGEVKEMYNDIELGVSYLM